MPYTPPAHVGNVDFDNTTANQDVHPNHHNAIADAVDAHTDVLGPSPIGSHDDIGDRFADAEAATAAHVGDTAAHTGVSASVVDNKISDHNAADPVHVAAHIQLEAPISASGYGSLTQVEQVLNQFADDINILKVLNSGSPTGYIVLPINGGTPPETDPATPTRIVSQVTPVSNAPKVTYPALRFDPGAPDHHWLWDFQMPGDFVPGTAALRLKWAPVAVLFAGGSGQVQWKAGFKSFGVGEDLDNSTWDQVAASALITPNSSDWGIVHETVVSLSTGMEVNGAVTVFIGRNSDADTYNQAVALIEATVEYQRATS